MLVAHGWHKRMLPMSSEHYYHPEEIQAMFVRVSKPLCLVVGGTYIRIPEDSESFAAQIVSAYHNELCRTLAPDAEWAEDTQRAEEEAQAHMEAESSEDEDYVTSEEDIDYEQHTEQQFFYQ